MRKVVQQCSACVCLPAFCSCVKETTGSPSCDRSCVKMADRFASREYSLKNKLGDRMIKQLLNSVSAKYRDLFVMCTIKIWLVNIGRTRTLLRPAGVSHSLYCVFAVPLPKLSSPERSRRLCRLQK